MANFVDQDKLLEKIDGIWDCCDMTFKPEDHICAPEDCKGCKWRQTKNALREMIEKAPKEDVAPVVRGKWTQDCDYHFRCSVCGDRWTVSNGNPLDVANGWNFCPNCGAKMEV